MRRICETSGAIIVAVFAIVAVVALAWGLMFNDWIMRGYFMPRQEAVRRETFEQSKAFNQGMIQELQNMQFEYVRADDDHKAALASIILHRTADYDVDRMPADLRQFVEELREIRSKPMGSVR